MSTALIVASSVIPSPLFDVFYSGYKIYSYSREGNKREMSICAEKMIKTLLRIVVAVPFALISWQVVNSEKYLTKLGTVGHAITACTFFGAGIAIMYPSSCIAVSALTMINSLRNCAQLYANPRFRGCFVFQLYRGNFIL